MFFPDKLLLCLREALLVSELEIHGLLHYLFPPAHFLSSASVLTRESLFRGGSPTPFFQVLFTTVSLLPSPQQMFKQFNLLEKQKSKHDAHGRSACPQQHGGQGAGSRGSYALRRCRPACFSVRTWAAASASNGSGGAGAGAAQPYLGVAVQAVHVELRGPGHHEVALAVVEEVAVHGELEAGGRVRLLVHGVHGAEPGLRGCEGNTVSRPPATAAHLAVGAGSRGTGTAVNAVRPRPEAERGGSGLLRLRSTSVVERLRGDSGFWWPRVAGDVAAPRRVPRVELRDPEVALTPGSH